MFLTGAIERFGTGIPEMNALTAERGLKAPDFEDNKTFLAKIWLPSAITAHDTVHDTGQVTVQVGRLNYLSEPERVVLILEGEMSRDGLMTCHCPKLGCVYSDPS